MTATIRDDDGHDVRAAREALADPAPSVPLADILDRYAADFAAYPDDER